MQDNEYITVEKPTKEQIDADFLPFRLTEEERKLIPPLERKLHDYQEKSIPDFIHGMELSPRDKYDLLLSGFMPSKEQEAKSTRTQYPETLATYRVDDQGSLVVDTVTPDGSPSIPLKKNEVVFIKNQNQFTMENSKFIKDQLTYLGFGDKSITDKFDEAVSQGPERFTLTVRPETETLAGNKSKFDLNFNKSSQTNMYFFNNFKTTLIDKTDNPMRSQSFHVNSTKGVTAKESLNLLEGRAVSTVLQYKEQESKVFAKLNFEETNKHGNFRYKTFNENYGVDVKSILSKAENHAGLKLDNATTDKLEKSLVKGNLIKSDFILNSKQTSGYIALDPEFKKLDFFDSDLKKLYHKQLGKGNARVKEETSVSVSVSTQQTNTEAQNTNNKQRVDPDANPLTKYREDDFTEALLDAVTSKNKNDQKSETVVLADLSHKQTDKITAFYRDGEGKLPSVTPKQMATVPKTVFGQVLTNEQRRELIFGNEVKLDVKNTLIPDLFNRILNVSREDDNGKEEVSPVQKSDVRYDAPGKEIKPFESSEQGQESSNGLSR